MKQFILTEAELVELATHSANSWAAYIEEMAPQFDSRPDMTPRMVCELLAKSIRLSNVPTSRERMN